MNKCTCTYCKACAGSGSILYPDPDWPGESVRLECADCWGDGLIDYCDYCRERDEEENQRESWFGY